MSAIELWYTQDGRSWSRYPLAKTEDNAPLPRPLVFDVNAEGVYGFTLVARSGVPASTIHHYRRSGMIPPAVRAATTYC